MADDPPMVFTDTTSLRDRDIQTIARGNGRRSERSRISAVIAVLGIACVALASGDRCGAEPAPSQNGSGPAHESILFPPGSLDVNFELGPARSADAGTSTRRAPVPKESRRFDKLNLRIQLPGFPWRERALPQPSSNVCVSLSEKML